MHTRPQPLSLLASQLPFACTEASATAWTLMMCPISPIRAIYKIASKKHVNVDQFIPQVVQQVIEGSHYNTSKPTGQSLFERRERCRDARGTHRERHSSYSLPANGLSLHARRSHHTVRSTPRPNFSRGCAEQSHIPSTSERGDCNLHGTVG